MSTPTPSQLNVPGQAKRRKNVPKLPLAVFNTSHPVPAPGKTPLPPSPSKIHPSAVIDSRVSIDSLEDTKKWKASAHEKSDSLVLFLNSPSIDGAVEIVEQLKDAPTLSALSISIPFPLFSGRPAAPISFPNTSVTSRITLSVQVTNPVITPAFIEGVKWALEQNHNVELDVRSLPHSSTRRPEEENPKGGYDYLEELIDKSQEGLAGAADAPDEAINPQTPAIIISNLLPPPVGRDVPSQQLATNPGYLAYQSHIASLSLHKNTYLTLLPPAWSPGLTETGLVDAKERNDWKRRIKLYLGPALEAFGEYRILYGSSSVSASDPIAPSAKINPLDWYLLAREAVTELGVEQEGVDAIFHENAKKVFARAIDTSGK
ncbi:uncharacterized protein EI90DRAFT_3156590 [Cantharellus anzutake]|uniref:uncharacterized protein n=1 Tax=Cantharellus anzutake TaxID=1750568 RepID=UPI001904B91B|nr:uncharacterized protein EI90DRAFT_3156590 [Cantharellus anzutake]KAF8326696.1 hypothetical protein EI90DRAFT_3156590 [Cantharellus anzutake]